MTTKSSQPAESVSQKGNEVNTCREAQYEYSYFISIQSKFWSYCTTHAHDICWGTRFNQDSTHLNPVDCSNCKFINWSKQCQDNTTKIRHLWYTLVRSIFNFLQQHTKLWTFPLRFKFNLLSFLITQVQVPTILLNMPGLTTTSACIYTAMAACTAFIAGRATSIYYTIGAPAMPTQFNQNDDTDMHAMQPSQHANAKAYVFPPSWVGCRQGSTQD